MNKNVAGIGLVLLALAGTVSASDPASKRWHAWRNSQDVYPLAAWSYFHRYAGSLEEYQTYQQSGLNLVQAPASQAANARAAGLGVVLGAFQDVHNDAGKLAELVDFANEHAEGAVAYSLKDEPVPGDYPALGRAMAYIYAHDRSGALPIIDFRPNWAVPYKRWGMTYETAVERFVEEVKPPVLLNCHYPLKRDGSTRPTFYANIEFFRKLALEKNIGLMGLIQVTAHTFKNSKEIDYRTPSESDLNWLVNSYLAYGAQGLWYYNWRIEDERFGEGLVEGDTGKPTALRPTVQRVNARVRALSSTLLKLRSKTVCHTDSIVPAGTTRYAEGMISGIHDLKGDGFIVSEFYNQDDARDGAVYLMIVNKRHAAAKSSDTLKQTCSFAIYPDFPTVSHFDPAAAKFVTRPAPKRRLSLELGGGEAAFLILRKR